MNTSSKQGVWSRNGLALRFPNLSGSIVLRDCEDLYRQLPLIFGGWVIDSIDDDQTPLVSVSRLGNGRYRVEAVWLDEGAEFDDPVDALCSLVAKVVRAWTMEQDDLLCLHGASVRIGGALAVFPNRYRAGKSILTAALAARGHDVYGDDVLPIRLAEGCGIAAGIAPRLRAPYPDNLDKATREYIETHAGLKGSRYHYLDLRQERLATLGSSAEIGAFVLLERDSGATPHLVPVPQAEVLRCVVWQNFAREVNAHSILERLSQIVSSANCYRLVYDRVDDAADLLSASLVEQQARPLERFTGPSSPSGSRKDADNIPDGHFQRRIGIIEVSRDGESFLADGDGASIHHLNPVGAAVWTLLKEPISPGQIIDILQTAFPETDRDQIETDVYDLLKSLQRKQLIINSDNCERPQ